MVASLYKEIIPPDAYIKYEEVVNQNVTTSVDISLAFRSDHWPRLLFFYLYGWRRRAQNSQLKNESSHSRISWHHIYLYCFVLLISLSDSPISCLPSPISAPPGLLKERQSWCIVWTYDILINETDGKEILPPFHSFWVLSTVRKKSFCVCKRDLNSQAIL